MVCAPQERARAAVVRLQAGDDEALRAWKMLCAQSELAFNVVYSLLDVDERLETRGESFYNSKLPKVRRPRHTRWEPALPPR